MAWLSQLCTDFYLRFSDTCILLMLAGSTQSLQWFCTPSHAVLHVSEPGMTKDRFLWHSLGSRYLENCFCPAKRSKEMKKKIDVHIGNVLY